MLGITVLTCGLGSMISGIIGLVEGIMYLTKSDRSSWRPISRDAVAGFEIACRNLLMSRQP